MENKRYVAPEMEIIEFEAEDVITASKEGYDYGQQDEAQLPIIPIWPRN